MIYRQTQSITINNNGETAKIMCDMQPMSGGLAQKEYGLEVDRAVEIFTAPCPILKEGATAAFDGESPRYIVKYVERWDDYAAAILTEIPRAVQDSAVDNETGENSMSDMYGGGVY